ncbi:MAG: porphobilinogen synthase [Solimonas sp.]
MRLRRLRRTSVLRDMMRETRLGASELIYPVFVEEGIEVAQEIPTMPGVLRIPERHLARELEAIARDGVRALLLFGISHHKDATGSDTCRDDGLMARMVRIAKATVPELLVITDNCFCEYTDHGHCGVAAGDSVDNDATLVLLGQQAVVAARAGVDMVAPSAMMDGQVRAIRDALDTAGYPHMPIMAYSSKFASALYGPFRAAAGCALQGDRASYQIDAMNGREALRESLLDEAEGADMLMVKPALAYLDVLARLRTQTLLPLVAYQVGGEYAMIKFAAAAGAIDEARTVQETLGAIKRAGADLVISYFARDFILGLGR